MSKTLTLCNMNIFINNGLYGVLLNKLITTYFIDFKLIGRATVGEAKEGFINKILIKAASYHEIYGIMLGKLDSKIKLLESATTRDEIKNIVW